MKMEFNEASILAAMSPVRLILGLVFMSFIGFWCAWKYRNTNDFAKSSRLYVFLVVPAFLILMLLDLGMLLSVGMLICGFIIMALISNHYFNS